MNFVTDIRRAGIELDIHEFIRELKRRARWYLPIGAPKSAANAAVTRRLADGDVAMPPGLEFPPYLVIVGVSRRYGREYCWRCPGCWQPRRFLYRWPDAWVWRCRRCWGLRYTSQAWPRMSPLWRELAAEYEFESIAQQRRAHVGRVGRPPTRTLRRLAAQEQRWWQRLSAPMALTSLELDAR